MCWGLLDLFLGCQPYRRTGARHKDFGLGEEGKSAGFNCITPAGEDDVHSPVKRPWLPALYSSDVQREASKSSSKRISKVSNGSHLEPSDDEEASRRAPSRKASGLINLRLSSASEWSQWSEATTPEEAENVDVNRLLENDVAKAMRMQSERRSTSREFQGYLLDLGFEFMDEKVKSAGRMNSWRQSETRVSTKSSNARDTELEMFYVRDIFGPPTCQSRVQPRHLSLTGTVKSVFSLARGSSLEVCASSSCATERATDPSSFAFHFAAYVQEPAHYIAQHSGFQAFFMLLTVYALFGMDLFDALGNSDQELSFVMINTVVFFCFAFELAMNVLGGLSRYLLSLEFVLDAIAVISIFTDTWFVQVDLLQDDAAGVMRMGRSSRLARLARLARIARFTRMMLHRMTCSSGRKWDVAKLYLMRRLWRIFLFLDSDRVGHIAAFDLKCFYMVILKNHPCFGEQQSRIKALEEDTHWFVNTFSNRAMLTWDEFVQDFMSTRVGRLLLEEHAKEVDDDESAWTLTRKVSDQSSLRISVVVLVLLGTITFFDPNRSAMTRRAAPLGLAGLQFVSRHEGKQDTDAALLCDSIKAYRYDLKFLYLDGYIRWEDGKCVTGNVTIDSPFREMNRLVRDFKLRSQDFYIVCVPDFQDCSAAETKLSSVCLIDNSANNRADAGRALLSTTLVIILLIVFISIMSAKMGHFARTMLSPLHTLLDDMNVLANLDLANVDEDMPGVGNEPEMRKTKGVSLEELSGLQESSKALRNAIRSWSKYVPPMVVQRLFAAGLEAEIGVAKITATILFCDLVGFEEACVGLEPEEVLQVLSTSLGTISEVITHNHGTLLEFIGDEVLAVFNAPNRLRQHVYAGVLSALEIHQAIGQLPEMDFSEGFEASGRTMRLRCRCGVHTGPILAGNIGSHQRMKYGLLGDSINLTARLKTLNSRYDTQTLISESAVSDDFCMARVGSRPVDVVAVKGKKKPTVVYEALLKEEDERYQAALKHGSAFKLYQERKFKEAAALFGEVNKVLGEADGPSKTLLSRCERYLAEPPPPDWDGVERLQAKSFH